VTITVLETTVLMLPDTGQSACYGAAGYVTGCSGTGQDAEFSINPMSFVDNGDGTVTDAVTGLMWQSEDDNTNYNWYQASGTYDAFYNYGVIDVCGSLSYAGYSDWWLPTKKELLGIVDFGAYSPAIDSTYFPNTESAKYWSSITYASDSYEAWPIYFYDGSTYSAWTDKSNLFSVRCVRGTHSPVLSLTDNLDSTVTDNVTGLMWQQEGNAGSYIWTDALAYCENSTLAGHVDWRLPNIKELESIIADDKSYPAVDLLFLYTYSTLYWSSTTMEAQPDNAWPVHFTDGSLPNTAHSKSNDYSVRCVRGN
jgi:hypothetical protein